MNAVSLENKTILVTGECEIIGSTRKKPEFMRVYAA